VLRARNLFTDATYINQRLNIDHSTILNFALFKEARRWTCWGIEVEIK